MNTNFLPRKKNMRLFLNLNTKHSEALYKDFRFFVLPSHEKLSDDTP